MKRLFLTAIALLFVLALSPQSRAEDCSQPAGSLDINPLPTLAQFSNTHSDPRLFRAFDGSFWLYYPNQHDYAAFRSTDLVHWCKESDSVFHTANYNLYCPAVYPASDGYYYLYYSLRDTSIDSESIGVAKATSPMGPYTDQGIIISGDADDSKLDPYVMHSSGDGHTYLYWTHRHKPDANGNGLYVYLMAQQLGSDYISRIGTASKALNLETDQQDWEGNIMEHPTAFYAPNAAASHRYYLLYNGKRGDGPDYAIGYSYSSSPLGPFTRAPAGTAQGQNPIVYKIPSIGLYGPGSPNTVVDNNGERWMLYRIKTTSDLTWTDRRTSIDILTRRGSDDALYVNPTVGTHFNPAPAF